MTELAPKSIEIVDTTLRDGAQWPGLIKNEVYGIPIEHRLKLIHDLGQIGVRNIEVFSPAVNALERDALPALIEKRDAMSVHNPRRQGMKILTHVRLDEEDIQSALDVRGVDGVNVYYATDPELNNSHTKPLSTQEIGTKARDILGNVRKDYPDLRIRFSGEGAFGTTDRDLFEVYDQLVGIVDILGTPDTTGTADADLVRNRVHALKARYPEIRLEGHFQDDKNLAVDNALVAAEAGMEYMDTTVLGLAERTGLPSMSAFLLRLFMLDPAYIAGYWTEDCYRLNEYWAWVLHTEVPPKEPVSRWAVTSTAGVHTSAIMNNSTAYNRLPLQKFGVTDVEYLLGPLSGTATVFYYLTHYFDFMGVTKSIAAELSAFLKENAAVMSEINSPDKMLFVKAIEMGLECGEPDAVFIFNDHTNSKTIGLPSNL